MCAIAGLIHCGNADLLQGMVRTTAHRGPDSDGLKWFSNLHSGLAHARLAIIDLSPGGHQPMASKDGRYWITFNGEIYNYKDLRNELIALGHCFTSSSDTEVILAAYQQWGDECLRRFNGMFAFAILDQHSGALFAARDQLGIKPFYYFHSGEQIVFASEIKAILQCPFVEKTPDFEALLTPARFQISPLTGFKNIRKLPPGHSLKFEKGGLKLHCYWKLQPTENTNISEAEAEEEVHSLLQDAVRLQMIADRPVGAFLSGGLDSSIIAALMRANTGREIHAFTVGFSEADQRFEQMPDDLRYARQIARQFDIRLHEFVLQPQIAELLPKMIYHLDEPLSDPAAINTYLIADAARQLGIVVMLNGIGGDEIFGGYRKHLACLKADTYQELFPSALRQSFEWCLRQSPVASGKKGSRHLRWMKRFASFASLPQAERYLSSDLSLSPGQFQQLFPGHSYHSTHFFRSQASVLQNLELSYLTRMCQNDTSVFLPEHNLTYADKATMAASIETRPPLTDYRLVEKMFTLPPEFRIRRNTQKILLKKIASRYLPTEVVHRPKAPFNAPLRSWIRGPLAPLVNELLSETSLKARGVYDHKFVRTAIEEDRRGLQDNGMLIWTLLTFELWFRTFFDSRHTVQTDSNTHLLHLTEPAIPSAKTDEITESPTADRKYALEDQLYPLLPIYNRLPQPVKQVAGAAYRQLPKRWRFGVNYTSFRKEAAEGEFWSPEKLQTYQLTHLQLVLKHAASTCEFYRKRFSDAGFDPKQFVDLDQLRTCPVLEKRDMTENLPSLVSSHFSSRSRLYMTTGGSTGTPIGFFLHKGISRPKEQAYLEEMWKRAGYFEGARLAVIRGHVTSDKAAGKIASYDATRDWLMLSSYHLTQERLPEYLAEIERFKPDILHAYPSAALQLAEFLEKAGQTWRVPLKALLCGSERLTLPQKRLLERIFKARVYRWYGHSERVVLAGEGRSSELFYFWPQYGFVEFGPPDQDGLQEVIGTSFHNLVMPLIRYRTGDYVRLSNLPDTEKEFPWPAAIEIAGREQEFLISATGRRISLTAFNMHDAIFDDLYAVQFFQDQPGVAEFRYIPGPRFHTSRLQQIESGVRRKLGDDFRIVFRQVSDVEKTARGKHKWLVTRL